MMVYPLSSLYSTHWTTSVPSRFVDPLQVRCTVVVVVVALYCSSNVPAAITCGMNKCGLCSQTTV